jgi:alanyl-tRNA synthetase
MSEVVELVQGEGGTTAVSLAQTYFYPESGGQPADRGTLGGYTVQDVTIRPSDQAVLHWLAEPEASLTVGQRVTGEIAWTRRFDHMQQHTGQHILSRAFINTAVADTIGFHLGQDLCTIDLNISQLTPSQRHQAEQLANQIIWENRPITSRFVTLAEAAQLPLRKQPEVAGDYLRLVDITDFDLTACGGTHVAQTGAVGQIKIVKTENRKQGVRISFVCGQRALADYEAKLTIIQNLTNELTTAPEALLGSLQKLQEENKAAKRTLRHYQEALAQYEVAAYRQAAEQVAGCDVVLIALDADRDSAALRSLVQGVIASASNPTLVLAGCAGEKPSFICQRTPDAPGEMKGVLLAGLAVVGARSGGGTAVLAQGSAPPLTLDQLQTCLAAMRTAWEDKIAVSFKL